MQDTPSQTQQATEAKSGVVAFPLVARLLALGGAALFALAAWLPWVIVTAAPIEGTTPNASSVRLVLTPGSISAWFLNSTPGPQGALFIWSALTVLGIPLAALTWMRVSRPIAWLLVIGYGLWLIVTLLFSIISAQYVLQSNTFIIEQPGNSKPPLLFENVSSRDPQIGLWLSGIALLLCLVGLWALISAARRAAPFIEATDHGALRRAAAQPPGATALTFGLVLWAIGFLWLAWASLGCPEFVLVSATCQGLSSDGAMIYAISLAGSNPLLVDPRVGEYAVSILLTVGALFIGVGVWRRGVSAALCAWATVWLVVAAAFAALAWYGVNLVVNDPTLTGSSSATWRGESGILFTTGALLICLVGVGLLWFALLFHRTQTSSA
ncbi:MAG TPA: hypothetical protein VH393_16240 [Ktedonobacterales bacterium]|jgi:hypothetical protein